MGRPTRSGKTQICESFEVFIDEVVNCRTVWGGRGLQWSVAFPVGAAVVRWGVDVAHEVAGRGSDEWSAVAYLVFRDRDLAEDLVTNALIGVTGGGAGSTR